MKILNIVFVVIFLAGALLYPATEARAHSIPDAGIEIYDNFDDIDNTEIISDINIEVLISYITNSSQDTKDMNNQVKGDRIQYSVDYRVAPVPYLLTNYLFTPDYTLSVDIPPPRASV